jgi:5-methylcytosine-specific restriction enzyme A
MGLSDITAPAVELALKEFDNKGRDQFLKDYGFGQARDYFLVNNGKRYDSKAIAAAAHGHLPDRKALAARDFSGGDATVAHKLRSLGYVVPPGRSPDWARDELILACDLVAQNDWRYLDAEDPEVVELSRLLQTLPIHSPQVRSGDFRNPNGVARKTADIATRHPQYAGKPTKGGALDAAVLDDFLSSPDEMHALAETLRNAAARGTFDVLPQAPDENETDAAREGRLLQRQHYSLERDRRLRARKIKEFLKTHPQVFCEVCGFDFHHTYGDRGAGYVEVHHKVPLHVSGEVTTKLSDLILLCANCHRMIHRATPWLTPDELRQLVSDSNLNNNSPNAASLAFPGRIGALERGD